MEREVDPVMERDDFKKLIDEYIDSSAKEILDGFTDDDIRMSGLSKQMIIDVAYKVYRVGEDVSDDDGGREDRNHEDRDEWEDWDENLFD